jgi:hypothetical protein
VRIPPAAIFVLGAIALAGVVGVVATQKARAAEEAGPPLPDDAVTFGFVVRSHAGGVPLLESTKAFEVGLANGPVHGTPPSAEVYAKASGIVSRELGRYPSAFLHKVRLAGIVLTDNLMEGETPIPSLPNVGGLLLIDASSAESDLVRGLHHEVFHFFDLADDGRVSPDPSWEALNASSFVYGSGGRTLRGSWAARPSDEIPGFVSAYATSGSEEDKAETFAFVLDAETPHRLGFDELRP